ncbi:thermonuclease family protein [Alisedimentitalea sp. MJ-SS2]|uniref:thermonuclease family protein n=1 Tax=Aliisedimentitalea sp. MJ-SS2 TaxID=3049795 RepID=UPI00291228CB|nr:thermonuclease family protein [Alisedimentitalea sp. MJ-SS2]MDU8929020.1 thermonuclease family protein [Alisedimentitalea sp. MJ-SS2]
MAIRRGAVLILARALIVTAATLAVWLYLVRWQDRGRELNTCRIGFVYDGDTVALKCGDNERTARVVGLDTPETRDARCDAEFQAGKRATERLRELVKGGAVSYRRKGTDKYGRLLIELSVDGEDVAGTLVREGLAMPYRGGGRINWCQRLGES